MKILIGSYKVGPVTSLKWGRGVATLLIGVITPFITGRGPPCKDPYTGDGHLTFSRNPYNGYIKLLLLG